MYVCRNARRVGQHNYYAVLSGGDTSIITSPRKNNMPIDLLVCVTNSSYVSGSVTCIVVTSSTSPRTRFKCASNACRKHHFMINKTNTLHRYEQ